MHGKTTLPALVVLLLTACDASTPVADTLPGRWYSERQVAHGKPLYQAHCATCHGADGSATPDWRTTDASGNYPPPPLNGTAHTWHHPLEVLTETIEKGGGQYGGLMPGFGQIIDAEGRLAVVAYIQAWWSDDVYARWAEIDAR